MRLAVRPDGAGPVTTAEGWAHRMRFDLSSDQEFFRETTSKFLAASVPVAELRRRRDDPSGHDEAYWRQGCELGWTSLLVDEAHGGGSISGDGLSDLVLVAHEFGAHAAPGPLVPCAVAAGALASHGGEQHAATVEGLVSGEVTAAWCDAGAAGTTTSPSLTTDGDELVLTGTLRPVEAAAGADVLLVTADHADGTSQVLVSADAAGVTVTPLTTIDLTRRFATVAFDGVRVAPSDLVGPAGAPADAVAAQRRQALALVLHESVGAMQVGFEMTVEWAFDRYSFGRPLASYQELKHRFADMKAWLEASHAVADAAVAAIAEGDPEADDLLSAGKAYVGQYGGELLQDCVQIHGGIGVTFEHDLHIYLRRFTVDRATHGTPADHRQRLTDLIEMRKVA